MITTAQLAFRPGLAIGMLLLLIGLGGCRACPESPIRATDDIAFDVMLASIPSYSPGGGAGSSLIFDAQPGPYMADEFTYRSDWPSVVSYYSRGQAVYYRERYYGYRGRDYGRTNPTYRRVDAVTYGAGFRP